MISMLESFADMYVHNGHDRGVAKEIDNLCSREGKEVP